jgi:hypothetical protein
LFVDTADHHGCLMIWLTITVVTNNHDGQQYQQTTDGQQYQQTTVMVSNINKQP